MCIEKAKEVLEIEKEAISDLINRIDKNFLNAIDLIYNCRGRVVVTGMGKAGIIGQKISATLSSTGTPSLWMHCAEAVHGDLGRVTKDDIVLILSNSGETEEIKRLLPVLKRIGTKIISLTGNLKSTLARYSEVVLDVSVKKEACPLGLAPTASTTAMLAIGDALAICLLEKKGFKKEDFAFYHPGGALGKRLFLKVEEIMRTGENNPVIDENKRIKDVLYAITKARAGAASIINKEKKLVGIFTDGDLRRHLEKDPNLSMKKVKDVMTRTPVVVKKDQLAVEALRILREKKIDEVVVVDDEDHPIGMLDVQDILKAGLV